MININCCICNKIFNVTMSEYSEWGNNPEPVTPAEDKQGDELRCCDRCNTEIVIPHRMNAGVPNALLIALKKSLRKELGL